MFKKLMSLEPERREAIINASLKEFASKSFDEASTNNIAKESNISKALMFHYIKNKNDFYLFLVDYCFNILKNNYLDKIDYSERDLFERIKKSTRFKIEIIKQYPLIFEFMRRALSSDKFSEVGKEVQKRRMKLESDASKKMMNENIDNSKFRKKLDIEKSKQLIYFALDGYSNNLRELLPDNTTKIDFDNIILEFESYIEELKKAFYN